MAKVRARVKELIPTAKYANIELDLEIEAEAEKIDVSGDIESALGEAYDMCERTLERKREVIIEQLEEGNK
jgi:hypothetical protein